MAPIYSYKSRRRAPTSKKVLLLLLLSVPSLAASQSSTDQQTKIKASPPESSTNSQPTASKPTKNSKKSKQDKCFCELSNKLIHDTNCLCDVDQLIEFNKQQILPTIEKLIKTDYFRYYKANINKGCEYWNEYYLCKTNKCGIDHCNPTELPPILAKDAEGKENAPETEAESCNSPSSIQDKIMTSVLSNIETNLDQDQEGSTEQEPESNEIKEKTSENSETEEPVMSRQEVANMQKHWDQHDKKQIEQDSKSQKIWQKSFCELDENNEDMKYYDLLKNPERYTGYNGAPAHRVWRKIYEENCYAEKEVSSLSDQFGQAGIPFAMGAAHLLEENKDENWWRQPNEVIKELDCVEKRVFFRAVSGLHSSISLHLTYMWFYPEEGLNGEFRPNMEEFERRFENENGRIYLENLYFVWLLELRALAKATVYLTNVNNIREIIHTGDVLSDIKTQSAIIELTEAIKSFEVHFDESHLFTGHNAEEMMEDFRQRMFKVSKIVDCADCEKCRLWGKLQTRGLATAVKIILTPIECLEKNISIISQDNPNRESAEIVEACENFRMDRGEIVSLFNAFARLSYSVEFVEKFKSDLKEKKRKVRESREQAKAAKSKKKEKSRDEL